MFIFYKYDKIIIKRERFLSMKKLKEQKKELIESWSKVKDGSYKKEDFEIELNKYNNQLLFLYLSISFILYILSIVIYGAIIDFDSIRLFFISIVMGLLIITIALMFYQGKKLEVSKDNEDKKE